MKKPWITKVYGVWHCGFKWRVPEVRSIVGIGFSRRAAFDDWKAKNYG